MSYKNTNINRKYSNFTYSLLRAVSAFRGRRNVFPNTSWHRVRKVKRNTDVSCIRFRFLSSIFQAGRRSRQLRVVACCLLLKLGKLVESKKEFLMRALICGARKPTPFGTWYPSIIVSCCKVLPFPITVEYFLKKKTYIFMKFRKFHDC